MSPDREPTAQMCPDGKVWEDHEHATECSCTNTCGDPGEGGCCYCNHLSVYEPCPVVGFGCGMDARPYVWAGVIREPSAQSRERCDCCTPEQWGAASTQAPGFDRGEARDVG